MILQTYFTIIIIIIIEVFTVIFVPFIVSLLNKSINFISKKLTPKPLHSTVFPAVSTMCLIMRTTWELIWREASYESVIISSYYMNTFCMLIHWSIQQQAEKQTETAVS